MSLMRWAPLMDPFEGFDEFFNRFPQISGDKSFIPAVDVFEKDNNVVVKTSLPGIDLKDVEVSVEKGILTIKGETKKEHEVDEKNYYRKEIRSGSFYRSVSLPASVKEDAVTAEFEDGVLKITCPKKTPTKAKKVAVKITKKEKK